MERLNERPALTVNGWMVVVALLVLLAADLALAATLVAQPSATGFCLAGIVLISLVGALCVPGFFTLQPNQARVLIFLGAYQGTERVSGFRWGNPFARKPLVSLRARNEVIAHLKVNDARGNPIEIGAVVVWRVRDTARAMFDVEDYARYVAVQNETALRGLASHYPYQAEGDALSLLGSPDRIADALRRQVQERLEVAGIEVLEARLSHLAYAPEIAQAMLRVQQADAVIAARSRIVEGAVGMVELALKHLSEKAVVVLDDERKAAMTNNLLVALVSEAQAQPILNAGTVYP